MRLLAVAALCGTLALGACANAPGFGTVTPGGQGTATTDPVVSQIQDITAKVCSFVPTVNTVLGIVAQFTSAGPIAGIAGEVANAVCNAINPKNRASRVSGPPNVQGVPVRGYYIK